MFDKDYFSEDATAESSRAGRVVGNVGAWGLHLAKVAFLVYSGYHGISASWNYAGNSDLARLAQMFGIILLEITLLSLPGLAQPADHRRGAIHRRWLTAGKGPAK